jgi:3-hydroxyisobutyrate dehydrogenase-like beta-hydroxyacid dehydrogenase
MGFPMAQNLHSKMPTGSRLIVCEIVEKTLKRFVVETEGVETAADPKEVAERCVSCAKR